jgi:hypothetical protein
MNDADANCGWSDVHAIDRDRMLRDDQPDCREAGERGGRTRRLPPSLLVSRHEYHRLDLPGHGLGRRSSASREPGQALKPEVLPLLRRGRPGGDLADVTSGCEQMTGSGARCLSTAGAGDTRCPMHTALAADFGPATGAADP